MTYDLIDESILDESKDTTNNDSLNDAISQKIAELQKLVSQLHDHGCLVLYGYNSAQDDNKGFVKGMIDGQGAMVKKALEKLAMNDESFRKILVAAYIDSMPNIDPYALEMMQKIANKEYE